MQIVPSGHSTSAGSRDGVRSGAGLVLASPRALQPAVASTDAARTPGRETAEPPASPKAGLPTWDPQRNQQQANAQQAVQFLDKLAARLQGLKSDLGSALGGAPVPQERLESQRKALSQLWAARAAQAGGQLDARLTYHEAAPASQGFAIRGLDAASLSSADRETLAIVLGAPTAARPATLVTLEPGLDAKALARRFDRALAPLGVRTEATPEGGLRFAVPEAQWPAVRDTLSIRGEGRRFPTGPFHRARVEAEPAALTPDTWSLETGASGRKTLQQIVEAQTQANRAREAALGALQRGNRQLDTAHAAQDGEWAKKYAEGFEALARGASAAGTPAAPANYQALFSLGAALPQVSRERIRSLLSTREA
jgi:hypothetical protein